MIKNEIDYSIINKDIFIEACDKNIQYIVKKILDNTKYISLRTFKLNLYKSFQELLENKIIYVYKPIKFTNKSNEWIYNLLLNYIKNKKLKIIIKLISHDELKILNNNDKIYILDDCIYTGSAMRNNLIEIQKYKEINKFLNIIIICPYISDEGIYKLTIKEEQIKYNYSLKIGKYNNISKYNIYNYISFSEALLLQSYYPNIDDIENLDDDRYNIWFDGYLLYFNHKLPDYASSIPLFYMGVIPNNYNKRIFNRRKRTKNIKLLLLDLQIIPLIKNCNYNGYNINTTMPICPYPPYKLKII